MSGVSTDDVVSLLGWEKQLGTLLYFKSWLVNSVEWLSWLDEHHEIWECNDLSLWQWSGQGPNNVSSLVAQFDLTVPEQLLMCWDMWIRSRTHTSVMSVIQSLTFTPRLEFSSDHEAWWRFCWSSTGSRVVFASVMGPHSFLCSFNQFLSCPELFIHEASWEESEAVLRSIINEQTHCEQQINAPTSSTPPECSPLNKYEVTTFYISFLTLNFFSPDMKRF